jgi:hypothetical protein
MDHFWIDFFSPSLTNRPVTYILCAGIPAAPDSEDDSERPTRKSSVDRKGGCDSSGVRNYLEKIYATADSINESDRQLLSHLPKDISIGLLGSSRPRCLGLRGRQAIPSVMMTCNSPDGPGSRRYRADVDVRVVEVAADESPPTLRN